MMNVITTISNINILIVIPAIAPLDNPIGTEHELKNKNNMYGVINLIYQQFEV